MGVGILGTADFLFSGIGLGVVSLTTTAFERSALEAVLLGKKATYKPLIVEMMPATQSGNSKP